MGNICLENNTNYEYNKTVGIYKNLCIQKEVSIHVRKKTQQYNIFNVSGYRELLQKA